MYIRTAFFLAFLALARSHDVIKGSNSTDARKIYDEILSASPALWQQSLKVTINTTEEEVISLIKITDLRENKDGEAAIIEGGEGMKNVTIELKSPTILRGYEFKIQIYAVRDGSFVAGKDEPKSNLNPEIPSEVGSGLIDNVNMTLHTFETSEKTDVHMSTEDTPVEVDSKDPTVIG